MPNRFAAGALAGRLHLPLGQGKAADNRKSALGALLGYATGVAIGTTYGAIGQGVHLPKAPAGVAVGLAAMAAADIRLVVRGLTDPRSWGASGWLADLLPHLVYGLVTVAALDAMEEAA